MKSWRKARVVFLGIVLLTVSGPVLARPSGIDVIQAKEVVSGDKFATGQIITNEGTIKGDLIFGGQNISSTGTVEGDVIGAGQDISLPGKVLGNVRVGGATVHLAGQIGKNVTLFGAAISLAQSSVVDGSATVFGGSITLDGKIKGRTLIGPLFSAARSPSMARSRGALSSVGAMSYWVASSLATSMSTTSP